MDQTARIEDGSGNIIVQAVASSVTVGLPPQLKLSPRHRRKHAPKPGVDIDLLNPFTDAIPFVGREDDLARLQEWLAIPKPISARCLIGRAGTGKTRLALQLCELAEALRPEWDAGFVEHRELERFTSLQNLSAWGWRRPTLIVVDYAAGITRWLRPWLEELAQNLGRNGAPLRLLMLERFADEGLGWWSELMRTGFSDAAIPELFDPPEPEPLNPIGAEHRTALVRAIMRAVRPEKADNTAGESERVESLAQRADATEALDALMAGLIAARQLAPAEDGRPWWRTAMAIGLARHERSRIERLAKDRNVSSATLEHLVAVVTLGGGIAIDAARPMIEEELAALPRGDSGSALDLREVLIDALREKERERIPPIVPDLIGEAFVVDALGKLTPAEQGEAVVRSYRRSPNATTATVIRTAQDFAETEDHPALSWIDGVARQCGTVEDLIPLVAALPSQSLQLRGRAATFTAVLVDSLRRIVDGGDENALSMYAMFLNDLANRLSAVGRWEEALAAAEEAVTAYDKLATQGPDLLQPNLAGSLDTLAIQLSAVGRWKEAMDASGKAVAIYEKLAAQRPDAFRPDLAMSLNNLSNRLSELGRREEALAAAEEAVVVYRELASLRPDVFRPELAASLSTLAHRMSALGRREEGLAAAKEAVDRGHQLAAQWPDTFRPDLALWLTVLSNNLGDLGRREEALAAVEEAVAIYHDLALLRSDAFRPNLALSLNNRGIRLLELGRREKALAAATQAVRMYRELATQRPDAYSPGLAMSLANLANGLSTLGRRKEALAAIEEAVAIYRELAALRPDAFRPDLALSLNNLADTLNALARPEESLAAIEEAVRIYRELASLRPDVFRSDLARSLAVLGNRLEAMGSLDQAMARGREAVAMLLPYLQRWPDTYAGLMQAVCAGYLRRCEAAGVEPDIEMLAPVVEVLQSCDLWMRRLCKRT